MRREEFEKICGFKNVIDAYIDEDGCITLIITAAYEYMGVTYDLGDWALSFGSDDEHITYDVVNYRNDNRKPDWVPGKYPDYTMPESENQFCLGTNRALIAGHFSAERYIQAIQLTIYCINSVNVGDDVHLREAFFPLKRKELAA